MYPKTMGMKGIVQVGIGHIGVVSLITKETAVQKHKIQIHIYNKVFKGRTL